LKWDTPTGKQIGRASVAVGLIALFPLLTGCETSSGGSKKAQAEISNVTKFSVAEYGVPASPRVTTDKEVAKGGGRELVGKPYKVAGKWYTPTEEPGYDKSGLASWYGPNFHGRKTANGEVYDQYHVSAAHPTFPLPSYARVTNKKNGHSVIVRVNDRGPFAHGRIIDLSSKAAELLAMKGDGVAAVRVQYVGRAPVDGDDTPYLMASYQAPDQIAPAGNGTMLAMNGPTPSAGLPGVGAAGSAADAATAFAAAPADAPVMTATTVAMTPSGETAAQAFLPAGFSLPEIGPYVVDRPELMVSAPEAARPEGFRDIGLAYRGNRVTVDVDPFALVLTGRKN
jgi:peptidoglycan lytic transglycosylase